jgi:DNA topoisomerase IB
VSDATVSSSSSTAPNGHLQATGLDAKGRRQYLYHPLWRLRRDEEKFDDMVEFAERLPDLRAVARGLLASDHADRERTVALAVRLLDIGLFRVGLGPYARDNGHVGLTTLGRENVTLQGLDVRFDFIAKSGKPRRMGVRDPQSVRVLADLRRRLGSPHELLVYPPQGTWHRIRPCRCGSMGTKWSLSCPRTSTRPPSASTSNTAFASC